MCRFLEFFRRWTQWGNVNTLRPRHNGRNFAYDIFKCIFLNENFWIPIKISMEFVSKGPINNIPSLFQIMVWRRAGAKPLSKPMMVSLLTHICVTRPQWVKYIYPVAYTLGEIYNHPWQNLTYYPSRVCVCAVGCMCAVGWVSVCVCVCGGGGGGGGGGGTNHWKDKNSSHLSWQIETFIVVIVFELIVTWWF